MLQGMTPRSQSCGSSLWSSRNRWNHSIHQIWKSLTPHARNHNHLIEGVGAGSPVGEEQAEADGLKDAGKSADGDGVHGALLGNDLGDDLESC